MFFLIMMILVYTRFALVWIVNSPVGLGAAEWLCGDLMLARGRGRTCVLCGCVVVTTLPAGGWRGD